MILEITGFQLTNISRFCQQLANKISTQNSGWLRMTTLATICNILPMFILLIFYALMIIALSPWHFSSLLLVWVENYSQTSSLSFSWSQSSMVSPLPLSKQIPKCIPWESTYLTWDSNSIIQKYSKNQEENKNEGQSKEREENFTYHLLCV